MKKEFLLLLMATSFISALGAANHHASVNKGRIPIEFPTELGHQLREKQRLFAEAFQKLQQEKLFTILELQQKPNAVELARTKLLRITKEVLTLIHTSLAKGIIHPNQITESNSTIRYFSLTFFNLHAETCKDLITNADDEKKSYFVTFAKNEAIFAANTAMAFGIWDDFRKMQTRK